MLKFYNQIIASVDNAWIYQSTALVLFVLFFISVVTLIFSRPKSFYNDRVNLPLED